MADYFIHFKYLKHEPPSANAVTCRDTSLEAVRSFMYTRCDEFLKNLDQGEARIDFVGRKTE